MRKMAVSPSPLETGGLLGGLVGTGISTGLYLANKNKPIRYRHGSYFSVSPERRIITAPTYREAKEGYGFTPKEYQAALDWNRGFIRHVKPYIAAGALGLTAYPTISYLSRKYLHAPTGIGIVAGFLGALALTNILYRQMVLKKIDKELGAKYGRSAASMYRKLQARRPYLKIFHGSAKWHERNMQY